MPPIECGSSGGKRGGKLQFEHLEDSLEDSILSPFPDCWLVLHLPWLTQSLPFLLILGDPAATPLSEPES